MFGFIKETKKKARKTTKNVKKAVNTSKKLGKAFADTGREEWNYQKKRAKKATGPAKRVADYVNKKMWGEL